jgi:hypothetical protein
MKSKEEILDSQKHGFNSGQYESALNAMEEYANQFKAQPKRSIQERKEEFWHKCLAIYCGVISNAQFELINQFFDYWTEHGENAKKMRFEKEKVFDIKKRLERWKRNQKTFNYEKSNQSTFDKQQSGYDNIFNDPSSPFAVSTQD